MKSLKIAFVSLLFIGLISCDNKTKIESHEEQKDVQKEIEQMKIKLEAAEAQLLNVSAELSNIKNELKADSITSK
jgi:uncharacterized membrane-anchored protein YhcB (DUF1043 family)